MEVSPEKPYEVIYSLFHHEYLGYMFEAYAVQLNPTGRLSFQHQKLSTQNANDFVEKLDENDFKLIELVSKCRQDILIKKFYKKKIKPIEFFIKVYKTDSIPNKALIAGIEAYLEDKRAGILSLLKGKRLFEMKKDGEPAGTEIAVKPEKAKVVFHFKKEGESILYYPSISYENQPVAFQYNESYIACHEPAWIVADKKLYGFKKKLDGKKLAPFLNKKSIVIPKKIEETYYKKFVVPLVASFDVDAEAFKIRDKLYPPTASLWIKEESAHAVQTSLFDGVQKSELSPKIRFELKFTYGDFAFPAGSQARNNVQVLKEGDEFVFYRIKRDEENEQDIVSWLKSVGLDLNFSTAIVEKAEAFAWIYENKTLLEEAGINIIQHGNKGADKGYYLGPSSISIEIREKTDWFDIHAVITFGEYSISFKELRSIILKGKTDILLPNGQKAVIPDQWIRNYSHLFKFAQEVAEGDRDVLKKYHFDLVEDLKNGNLAQVTMTEKLKNLQSFEKIEEYELPKDFKGSLRPYQKAGFDWLNFLESFNFGGCLADDMGLGKTVQTLALLQKEGEKSNGQNRGTSLLVMPTSLLYNWQEEAKKFTPNLKLLVYAGTGRDKDIAHFENYDIVITSYGIVRIDIEILNKYYFNYVILDESQAIKNPSSNIAQAVGTLQSSKRLILTGTPIENSTMDLWSQMNFLNPGLLGSQAFFKNQYLIPIEKRKDAGRTAKLNALLKPFVLRRDKTQVAKDLPEKIENVIYSDMSKAQQEKYDEVKDYYRNLILEKIDSEGMNKSQFLLLQGLTKLRQIANHPKLTDPDYKEDSGKMSDVLELLQTAIKGKHKILIFSQFVKHLALFKTYLQEQEIAFSYLDGNTRNRRAEIDRFQTEEDLQVFLISLKAGGLGINLTKADYVFILDPWWNPAVEAQAVDRAHRIGQENRVFIYKFISKNSVEEKILRLQKSKIKLAEELITQEESFVKKLERSDIVALLE